MSPRASRGLWKEAWLQMTFCKALKMTFGNLTLMCAWGGGRGRLEDRWNIAKQLQWSIQRNALFTGVGFVKSFLNCYAKGTCSSQVTEAIASFLRAQWWIMRWSRCQHLPINQFLGGDACLSWRSNFSSSMLASPKIWAQHAEALTYTPQQVTLTSLLPHCCSIYTAYNPRKI